MTLGKSSSADSEAPVPLVAALLADDECCKDRVLSLEMEKNHVTSKLRLIDSMLRKKKRKFINKAF